MLIGGLHSSVSNVGFNRNSSKKSWIKLNECISFSILRNQKSPQFLLEITPSACVQFTLPVSDKIKQSTQKPHGDGFSAFLLVCVCLYFVTLNFVKHKRNTSKMCPNLQVVELFVHCVIPENIHTSPTKGILSKTPHPSGNAN